MLSLRPYVFVLRYLYTSFVLVQGWESTILWFWKNISFWLSRFLLWLSFPTFAFSFTSSGSCGSCSTWTVDKHLQLCGGFWVVCVTYYFAYSEYCCMVSWLDSSLLASLADAELLLWRSLFSWGQFRGSVSDSHGLVLSVIHLWSDTALMFVCDWLLYCGQNCELGCLGIHWRVLLLAVMWPPLAKYCSYCCHLGFSNCAASDLLPVAHLVFRIVPMVCVLCLSLQIHSRLDSWGMLYSWSLCCWLDASQTMTYQKRIGLRLFCEISFIH